MGDHGLVKVPLEIFEEIKPSPTRTDELVDWLKAHRDELLLGEEVRKDLVARVVEEGYGNNLTDIDVEKIGRDPFLLAYALVNTHERCVISNERSRPTLTGGNRRVPDACDQLKIIYDNMFGLIRALDFSTDWKIRP